RMMGMGAGGLRYVRHIHGFIQGGARSRRVPRVPRAVRITRRTRPPVRADEPTTIRIKGGTRMRNGATSVSDAPSIQRTGGARVASVELGDPELERVVTEGMRASEALLIEELGKGEEFLVEHVRHLADAGGKRFRPMFAMLA